MIPPVGAMTAQWLRERYGREDAPGWPAVRDDDGEGQTFVGGGPTALCWAWADAVIADLGAGRAVRTGYFCSPASRSAVAGVADGHDLALVDDRFLVDGWTAFVEGIGPAVLDLADVGDLARAAVVHEPFAAWERIPAAATAQFTEPS